MKRIFISLAVVLALVAVMAVPAMAAEEQNLGASVSVNEFISITLTDTSPTGITFGSVNDGSTDNPDTAQSETTPAVSVNVASETNVDVDLGIKGDEVTGLPLSNWKYSTTYAGTKSGLTTSYVAFDTNVSPGASSDLWHWLDVPDGTTAGSYNTNFYYKAIATGGSF